MWLRAFKWALFIIIGQGFAKLWPFLVRSPTKIEEGIEASFLDGQRTVEVAEGPTDMEVEIFIEVYKLYLRSDRLQTLFKKYVLILYHKK